MERKSPNTLFFVLLLLGLYLGWTALGNYLWPEKPKPKPDDAVAEAKDEPPPADNVARVARPPAVPVEEGGDLTEVVLGGDDWHIKATLTPRGAGVRALVLNDFQQADAYGKPVWVDRPNKVPKKLELIPEDRNKEIASFLLHHFADSADKFSLDTLGRRVWKRVGDATDRRAAFQTTQRGVRITKTFTLEPRDYHLGLEVKLELVEPDAKEREFRYEMYGARGLPIEGQYYTSTLRNAAIGRVTETGHAERELQDQRTVAHKGGGDLVGKLDRSLRFAGTSVQYFTSVIAVDPRDQKDLDFLSEARPVLVNATFRGKVVGEPSATELKVREVGKKEPRTFALRDGTGFDRTAERVTPLLTDGADVVVVYREEYDKDRKDKDNKDLRSEIVVDLLDGAKALPGMHDDMTVVVRTAGERGKALRLRPGEPIVHKYVLFNGPVKVMLLGQLRLDHDLDGQTKGSPAIDDALLTFYRDELHLKTLTDYPTTVFGRFFAPIGLTGLVIWLTNGLHTVLYWLYRGIGVYGICIVLLTVMVRGLMYPISRKQARQGQRMQELAPEIKKLKEKYGDDKQQLQLETMKLYRRFGVNPLGSCWMVFLQTPVFISLYGALQESIHFRLANFLWVDNLAAPDQLIRWGESIPLLSDPSYYSGILSIFYLGPYFNLLPLIAVALQFVQMKLTMPPAMDEQQEMQMKTMKYMIVFMALMFYKIAAGLTIYFIVSSLWTYAERKLLPKKKPGDAPPPLPEAKPGLMGRLLEKIEEMQRQATGQPATAPATPSVAANGQQSGGRGKKRRGDRGRTPSAAPPPADGFLGRLRAWWEEVLRQAQKK